MAPSTRSLGVIAIAAVALLVAAATVQAGDGFDISQAASTTNLQCMKNNGYTSVVIRAFRSSGTADSNAKQSLLNARSAGIAHIDIYMFPCPTCSATAAQQFDAMIAGVSGAQFGIAWLDIEQDSAGQYWSTNYATNKAFYEGLLSRCAATGYTCGVYSNANNWNSIFGSTTYQATNGAQRPVWYAQYNGAKSFSGYSAFGGWSTPNMKQYAAPTSTTCNMGMDLNWWSDDSFWSTGTNSGSTGSSSGCQVNGTKGGCTDTTQCGNVNGQSTAGLCAGASNIQCCTPKTCTAGSNGSGNCKSTTGCSNDRGSSYAGYCAGASNIQCCVQPSCTASGVSGKCMDTDSCSAFGGRSTSGLCAGASNIQCCTY